MTLATTIVYASCIRPAVGDWRTKEDSTFVLLHLVVAHGVIKCVCCIRFHEKRHGRLSLFRLDEQCNLT